MPDQDSQIPSPFEILLVEDNTGDVRLTRDAMRDARILHNLTVAKDGVEAFEILRKEGKHADAARPDLIILDLNLPRMDGREVLAALKSDSTLRSIPVVMLTSSATERDIASSYDLGANCYITKPVDLDQFIMVIRAVEDFWLTVVKLPKGDRSK